MTSLKSCPKCGGDAYRLTVGHDNDTAIVTVSCDSVKCYAIHGVTFMGTVESATHQWNEYASSANYA